jgi:hypothetical protein
MTLRNEDVFIWTEAFNCGEILAPMLSSYVKHHNLPIHVYGTQNDLDEVLVKSDLIVFEKLNKRYNAVSVLDKILKGYKNGHKGTAILWAYLIKTRSEKIFIHLDSDTIFLEDVVTDLIDAIMMQGYSIAGSRRAYKNRAYRKEGLDGKLLNLRPDAVNTDCFAFDTQYINKHPYFWLRRKILGRRVSINPVVDFFDPITFEIIKKGGLIKYMDSPDGGFNSFIDNDSKFIKSRISFAAVGSGCNFYKNGHTGIPKGYSDFALASYSLFAFEFLQKNTGIAPLKSEELESKLLLLDKENWVLKQKT